jgi:transcriptional regulator with XRE-family HTH domain
MKNVDNQEGAAARGARHNAPPCQSDFSVQFGNQLKELRLEHGFTQKQTAHILFVAESTYANWEQGRREPSLLHLHGLVAVYGIDFNTLFDFLNQ